MRRVGTGMRWLGVGALILAASGSAGAQAVAPAAAPVRTGPAFAQTLTRARAAKRALELKAAPRHAATSDSDFRRFMSLKFGPWLTEARALHDGAAADYVRAHQAATRDEERVLALSEAGEMSLSFSERIYRAGEAAIPKSIAKDPELRRTYLSSIDDMLEPSRASAVATLARCADLAQERGIASLAARRCSELRKKPFVVDPKARTNPALVGRGIQQLRHRLRACYEAELKHDPALSGDLRVVLRVAPSGVVDSVKLEGSLGSHRLAGCVNKHLAALAFPPTAGRAVSVTYPLTFQP